MSSGTSVVQEHTILPRAPFLQECSHLRGRTGPVGWRSMRTDALQQIVAPKGGPLWHLRHGEFITTRPVKLYPSSSPRACVGGGWTFSPAAHQLPAFWNPSL